MALSQGCAVPLLQGRLVSTPTYTRWADVQPGDSLRRIALRELGDALRWIELANINQLRPPYIIDSLNAADRQRATLLWGDRIAIPIGSVAETVQIADDVLGIDAALPQGRVAATDSGDWSIISGNANLRQALAHRLKTPTGDLLAHPEYGCDTQLLLGLRNQRSQQALLIGTVRRAIAQDPRVARTDQVRTAAQGDQLHVQAHVIPVNRNTPADLNLVFPLR